MSLMKAALQHTTQFPISVKAVQRAVAWWRDIDRIRTLEGNYITNLSSKNSRYQLHKKCPLWRMLVAGYMLNFGTVVSRENDNFFIKGGLSRCLECKNKAH